MGMHIAAQVEFTAALFCYAVGAKDLLHDVFGVAGGEVQLDTVASLCSAGKEVAEGVVAYELQALNEIIDSLFGGHKGAGQVSDADLMRGEIVVEKGVEALDEMLNTELVCVVLGGSCEARHVKVCDRNDKEIELVHYFLGYTYGQVLVHFSFASEEEFYLVILRQGE